MSNLFIELPPEVRKQIEDDSVIELNKILTDDPKTSQVVLNDVTLKFLKFIKRHKASHYFKDQKHSKDLKEAQECIDRLTERIQEIYKPKN